MNHHEQVIELLGAYAVDALDKADADMVRAHISWCPVCQVELASFHEVSARLASLNATQPPPGLGDRVLAAVEREARAKRISSRRYPVRPRLQWIWTVVAVVAIALLGAQAWLISELSSLQLLVEQQEQIQTILLSADQAPIELLPPDPSSTAHGFYRAEPELGIGLLNYYQLPPPASGHFYQCWFEFSTGSAVACGRLPLEEGHGLLLVTVPELTPDRVRVTLEASRVAAPTGSTILVADLK